MLKSGMIEVDELVIKFADQIFENTVKLLNIDDHTGTRIDLTRECHPEPIVVAMSIWADTFAESPIYFFQLKSDGFQ